jgi:hypothetical protein
MKRWFSDWGFVMALEGWPLIVGPTIAEFCLIKSETSWAWYWHLVLDFGAAAAAFLLWDLAGAMADDEDPGSLVVDWLKSLRRKETPVARDYSAD